MTATLSRPAKPARAEANTYGLPRGERLRRELVTVFRLQRRAILRYMRTGHKDLHDPIPTDWPDWNDFRLGALAMSERMTPLLELTWDQAAAKFAPRVGLDPNSWEVVNPHTERMIEQAALDFCASTNATTSLSLDEALTKTREELHAGIVDKGEALPKLTKRINAIFDGAEKWRARRIAQTETSRAVHAAQEQAAIASGVVTGWAWLLSSDACPLCQTIARRAPAVRLGHAFAVIGDSHAYSQIRMPPAHPHCNCSAIEILDTDIQPQFADTLHQPQPEEVDETGPPTVPFSPKPAPLGKPAPPPKPKPKPAAARPKPPARPKKPQPAIPQPQPGQPGPAGKPVGDALDVQAKGGFKKVVEDAIRAINGVHGDGNLPQIPVKQTSGKSRLGCFWRKFDGTPIKIDVSAKGDHPRMTAAHEIGHFLDYNGVPKTHVGYGGTLYRDFRKESQFSEWVRAIEDSAAVKKLRDAMTRKYVVIGEIVIGGHIHEQRYNIDSNHAKYLVSDIELWARSYSQYIALKSRNPEMRKELDKHRDTNYSKVYGDQWADDDFAPIATAFDSLFKHLGWIQ